jgi:alkylation response protein AidB-like acyl-CoA dehydrogenase
VDLTFSDEQLMLKQSVADFVKREAPPDRIAQLYKDGRMYEPGLFKKGAELGWLGMLVPEQYGGGGMTTTDCALVFEELGRGAVPGPFFSSGVLGALLIAHGGSEEQKQHLLPRICSGQLIVTLAAMDAGPGWAPGLVETELRRNANGALALRGTKQFVHDADGAGTFICLAQSPEGRGITLVLVDSAASGVTLVPKVGLLTSLTEVRFDGVEVAEDMMLGEPGQGWEMLDAALQRALPVLCAYKVGACQEIFDVTAAYTGVRVVFGQPIGRFQRVQDHMVDLVDHLDAARWITYEALWRLDAGLPSRAGVHEAKAVASEAYYQVCNYAHMVHAGPGTALDHPLVCHTILSRTLYQYLGDPLYHKRRMMDALYPVTR